LEYAEISDPKVQMLSGEKYKKPFYTILVSGERARKLVKLLYADAPILGRLERKYKTAIDWFKVDEKEVWTEIKILKLAKAYKKKYGKRPSALSGKIEGFDETWSSINSALCQGYKGLKGGSSLSKLLTKNKI
jgi:hypothetical protein